ncbi:MAG: tripartite tricarboxylate transporter substrate binding protein, partial [Proteobacteria bacterium]|nr:tripartite tricarboxylate transporter substrate binding protein [Pseudomonadota bacterium]
AGSDMVLSAPQDAQAYVRSEVTRWGQVIKAADIKPE